MLLEDPEPGALVLFVLGALVLLTLLGTGGGLGGEAGGFFLVDLRMRVASTSSLYVAAAACPAP